MYFKVFFMGEKGGGVKRLNVSIFFKNIVCILLFKKKYNKKVWVIVGHADPVSLHNLLN